MLREHTIHALVEHLQHLPPPFACTPTITDGPIGGTFESLSYAGFEVSNDFNTASPSEAEGTNFMADLISTAENIADDSFFLGYNNIEN